ncbi:MAG: hypothetical protein OEW00_08400 [candidate division Zixibacteria bacterium]|nr:hypothetical protein [candidate division Zixibacteria bacterium]
MDSRDVLRRHLATLAYRTQHALTGAPDGFADFDVGNGVRTPHQIMSHMLAMVEATSERYLGKKIERSGEVPWEEAISRYHSALADLDKALAAVEAPDSDTVLRLFQGPWLDAMTHVGQLMMLRRLAGAPVSGANYYRADIKDGQLGPEQPLPEGNR